MNGLNLRSLKSKGVLNNIQIDYKNEENFMTY